MLKKTIYSDHKHIRIISLNAAVLLIGVASFFIGQQIVSLGGEETTKGASLQLEAENVSKNRDGSSVFSLGGEVNVKINLDSGSFQVETAEAILTYDPQILSVKHINTQGDLTELGTAFKAEAVKDETGKEVGRGILTKSAVPLPPVVSDGELKFTPLAAGQVGSIGSVVFSVKAPTAGSQIGILFAPTVGNDSNVIAHKANGKDVLGKVESLPFTAQ